VAAVRGPRARAALIPWPGFDVDHPSRVGAACRHIGQLLADGGWHRWTGIETPVAADHDLKPKTVYNLLHGMAKMGGIERRGRYRRRHDGRKVRLAAHGGSAAV
jgi:hypothetical protein